MPLTAATPRRAGKHTDSGHDLSVIGGLSALSLDALSSVAYELSLGILLGAMLVGLSVLIRVHHFVPRGGVTLLAQATAGAFGTGVPFYISNLAVTLVLALAANTSFGGLPVLMSLLARDHRLPHLFYLRAERPVYRHGIVALALA